MKALDELYEPYDDMMGRSLFVTILVIATILLLPIVIGLAIAELIHGRGTGNFKFKPQ